MSAGVLFLGRRRFVERDPARPRPWSLDDALAVSTIDPERTPTAWRRLVEAGFPDFVSADLLPPGAGWPEALAVASAAALAAPIRARFRAVVLLGGVVRDAFAEALRLRDLAAIRDHGGPVGGCFFVLPSPHDKTSRCWTQPAGLRAAADLAAAVRRLDAVRPAC